MSDQPVSYPGGYQTGTDAIRGLVQLSQLLGAAQDCRVRLNMALSSIDSMITMTNGARQDALRAVERFADENPTSLGIGASTTLESGLATIEGNLSTLERDVRELLRSAEEQGR